MKVTVRQYEHADGERTWIWLPAGRPEWLLQHRDMAGVAHKGSPDIDEMEKELESLEFVRCPDVELHVPNLPLPWPELDDGHILGDLLTRIWNNRQAYMPMDEVFLDLRSIEEGLR